MPDPCWVMLGIRSELKDEKHMLQLCLLGFLADDRGKALAMCAERAAEDGVMGEGASIIIDIARPRQDIKSAFYRWLADVDIIGADANYLFQLFSQEMVKLLSRERPAQTN